MRLLDLGCGPGSITVGLGADAIGVDIAPVPIDGVPVAAADGAALPFRDGSFDALYANAVLQHVPDPLAVLAEARRVARPGAVVGLGDADWDGVLLHPHDPLIDRGTAVHEALRPGSSIRVGRELRGILDAAGFERCVASASGHAEGSPEAAGRAAGFESSWFAAPEVVADAVELGASGPAALLGDPLRAADPRSDWSGPSFPSEQPPGKRNATPGWWREGGKWAASWRGRCRAHFLPRRRARHLFWSCGWPALTNGQPQDAGSRQKDQAQSFSAFTWVRTLPVAQS